MFRYFAVSTLAIALVLSAIVIVRAQTYPSSLSGVDPATLQEIANKINASRLIVPDGAVAPAAPADGIDHMPSGALCGLDSVPPIGNRYACKGHYPIEGCPPGYRNDVYVGMIWPAGIFPGYAIRTCIKM